tara:strand:+ start:6195 stop:7103 length:909 start_codon:yes stop_codon:yes gene_type:complete
MKNYRKSLPSLDNLPFFLAAARNKSLTAAAEELFVTQAAVSKRIHRLEGWLGVNLFSRDGRNLKINSAGKEFASDVEVALDFLDHAVRKIKAPEEPVVRIASSTTISMYWLYDRLKGFSRTENACNVYVTTTDSTTELTSGPHDLFILFCDGNVPDMECVKIFDCELIAAAAPNVSNKANRTGIFSAKGPPADMPPLLEYSNMNPDWVNWQLWLKLLKKSDIKNWPTLQCDSYIESIAKARKGSGVALLHLPMMQQELVDGALEKIDTESLTTKKSYYLCYQKSTTLPHNAEKLLEFLSGSK